MPCRPSIRALLAALVILGALTPASAGAQGSDRTTRGGRDEAHVHSIRAAVAARATLLAKRRVRTVAAVSSATLRQSPPPANQAPRSWVARHPVVFGAIVGAVGGAAIVAATVDAEASPAGFYGGGAAGALVGWVVSR